MEDAPRGMESLCSLNRFKIATSRARAAAVVVGSPRLLEPECRAYARYNVRMRCAGTLNWRPSSRPGRGGVIA